MIDRERTIDNLEQQIRWIRDIECHKFAGWLHAVMAMEDAIRLLKEQAPEQRPEPEPEQEPKPVEPEMEGGRTGWWLVCGECHTQIGSNDHYCRECGRKIKWAEI